MNDYDLEAAARTLLNVDQERFEEFPGISRRILEFFENQRSGDTYGHWVDERRLYRKRHGTRSSFERELVEPVSESCFEAVDHLSTAVHTTT